MIKYISIVIATFLILGCDIKTPIVNVMSQKTPTIKQEVQSSKVIEVTKEPKRMTLPEGFREVKKLKPIGTNVPKTCQEWSDGCNTCSRAKDNQASCTIYTCENKAPFSCLKWQ